MIILKAKMNNLELFFRICVGLNFFVFGVDAYLHKIPMPAVAPAMENFGRAMVESRFILPTVKGIEILAGAALLANFAVPLGIVMLAPVVFGIIAAHFFLNRGQGWGISAWTLIPYLGLCICHREIFVYLITGPAGP